METGTVRSLYEVNHYAIKANLEGLTNDQAFISPGAGGNCIHWVLGHILTQRRAILLLLEEEPVWSEELAARYKRGSAPVREKSGTRPLGSMVADFDLTQERLLSGLDKLSSKTLPPDAERDLSAKLAMLQFHEAYHAGQIGLLRRIAGSPGAIR